MCVVLAHRAAAHEASAAREATVASGLALAPVEHWALARYLITLNPRAEMVVTLNPGAEMGIVAMRQTSIYFHN